MLEHPRRGSAWPFALLVFLLLGVGIYFTMQRREQALRAQMRAEVARQQAEEIAHRNRELLEHLERSGDEGSGGADGALQPGDLAPPGELREALDRWLAGEDLLTSEREALGRWLAGVGPELDEATDALRVRYRILPTESRDGETVRRLGVAYDTSRALQAQGLAAAEEGDARRAEEAVEALLDLAAGMLDGENLVHLVVHLHAFEGAVAVAERAELEPSGLLRERLDPDRVRAAFERALRGERRGLVDAFGLHDAAMLEELGLSTLLSLRDALEVYEGWIEAVEQAPDGSLGRIDPPREEGSDWGDVLVPALEDVRRRAAEVQERARALAGG